MNGAPGEDKNGWHRKLMADNLATDTALTLAPGRIAARVNYVVIK